MANYGDIPLNVSMPPNHGVRRNAEDTEFEPFDTAPYSQSAATRSLDTSFQPSTDHNVLVVYTVQILSELTLLDDDNGTVFLEISEDENDWQQVCSLDNSLNGTGITINHTVAAPLVGTVPAGWFVRLRTGGDATFTYMSGQETVLFG